MKGLVIVLSLLTGLSSYASCDVLVSQSGDVGAADVIVEYAKDQLVKKGYRIAYDKKDADLILRLSTQSSGMTQEHDTTVGASTKLVEAGTERILYLEHKYKGGFPAFGINKLQRTKIAKKQIRGIPDCGSIR